jgi:hypothetical protein
MGNITEIKEISNLLNNWTTDNNGMKIAFTGMVSLLESLEGLVYSFKSRPGISYSLRASIDNSEEKLLTLMDIIDDDPENRWISICFYADTISDPDEEGDLIPGGLLGEDGYCFDLFENDEDSVSYIKDRIIEAYGKYF